MILYLAGNRGTFKVHQNNLEMKLLNLHPKRLLSYFFIEKANDKNALASFLTIKQLI
jgi:hypothetical protein